MAVVELAVVELAVVELAVLEPVAEAMAVVELAPVELASGQELAAVMAPVAVAVMVSEILTSVHTDRLTRTAGARECFGFIGFSRAQRIGLVAAGLAAGLLIGSINARSSLVGMCGGTRACAMSTGLTVLGG
jgi:hypothetical protein